MCFGGRSSPPPPPPPPPPPEPPKPADTSKEVARAADAERATRGRASTMLTGAGGVPADEEMAQKKRLLGSKSTLGS